MCLVGFGISQHKHSDRKTIDWPYSSAFYLFITHGLSLAHNLNKLISINGPLIAQKAGQWRRSVLVFQADEMIQALEESFRIQQNACY